MNNDLFDIVIVPDPVLREKAQPVNRVTSELKTIFEKMHRSMKEAEGIGLAANQVGLLHRICVVDVVQNGAQKIFMTNPEILWKSDEITPYNEGCLSIPGYHGEVIRPEEIRVSYIDENNQKQEYHARGLEAKCIQHEIDHLDGILFIDYLSRLKRDVILRKLAKDVREGVIL